MKPADQWTTAEATAAKAKPPVKFCLECDQPFTRLYRDVNGRPRSAGIAAVVLGRFVLLEGLLRRLSWPQELAAVSAAASARA